MEITMYASQFKQVTAERNNLVERALHISGVRVPIHSREKIIRKLEKREKHPPVNVMKTEKLDE